MASLKSNTELVFDVVIVGAGLAGLQAAFELHKKGLSYTILEARDRVGGKTLSSDRYGSKIKQELGAAWVNDTNQSHIWALAKDFGLTTITQNTAGDVVVEDFSKDLIMFPYGDVPVYASSEDTQACVSIRDLVEKTSLSLLTMSKEARAQLDAMSFEKFLHQNAGNSTKAQATGQVWTHAMLGVDPSEVSALYFLDYCRAGGGLMTMRSDCKDGGQYLRIEEGVSTLAERMAARLASGSVHLSSPVCAITQNAASGTVQLTVNPKSTNTPTPIPRTYSAKRVILTLPTPVYKTISFSPPLPPAKQAYLSATRYGHYTKYIIAFQTPFWRAKGLCGLAQSFLGPVSVFRDTSTPRTPTDDEMHCLTCFIGGTFGRQWTAKPVAEKRASVLQQISRLFNGGASVDELVVDVLESPWMTEEFSGFGCPCAVTPPGVLDACWDAFVAPVGGLYFAGTETADVWRGYMDGAVRSGEHAAAEVIASLEK